MLSLLILYKWTILAGVVAAPALALLGAQLATRDRAMQTLCVGQGAMVGVLCGIGIVYTEDLSWMGGIGPLMVAVVFSSATYLVTDFLVGNKTASKNTTFAFIFALLLATGSLVAALFPGLEQHMAQVYFGDLATLTTFDSQVALFASLGGLALLVSLWKAISNQSFEWAVFGEEISLVSKAWGLRGFKLVTILMLSLSVQFVGFLFTIAMLFLPTALMNFLTTKGVRLHLWLSSGLAVVSTLVGFLLSLQFTRLPTVPTIVAVMFMGALLVIGAERVVLLLTRGRAALPRDLATPELAPQN